jgi:hypothetical protein
MKRHNFEIYHKLMETIWTCEKKNMGRGEGEFYSQFGIFPLSKSITLMNIRFFFVICFLVICV